MSRYYCRHCGIEVRQHWISDTYWVHVEQRSGLLGSDECYPTPKAEPVLA